MSVWRRLREDLTAKLPEWHAAAQARERREDAEREATRAAEFESVQPVIARIRAYLSVNTNWTPSDVNFTLFPEAIAHVPPELMVGSTTDVTDTIESEYGDFRLRFSTIWNDAAPRKVTLRLGERQVIGVPTPVQAAVSTAIAASAPPMEEEPERKQAATEEHKFNPETGFCTCLGAKVFHDDRRRVYVYGDGDRQTDYWSDIDDYEDDKVAKLEALNGEEPESEEGDG